VSAKQLFNVAMTKIADKKLTLLKSQNDKANKNHPKGIKLFIGEIGQPKKTTLR